jgi:hypothetical protein
VTVDGGTDQADDAQHSAAAKRLVAAGHGLLRYADHVTDTPQRYTGRTLQRVDNFGVNVIYHGGTLPL